MSTIFGRCLSALIAVCCTASCTGLPAIGGRLPTSTAEGFLLLTSPAPSPVFATSVADTPTPIISPAAAPSPLPTITATITVFVPVDATEVAGATDIANPGACLPDSLEAEYGIVKWVPDGNTIVVDLNGRLVSVRYLGVDAPAYIPNIQVGGPPAARRNEELVLNRVVRLIREGRDRDHLGELLRYVLVDDLFVNYELIREGWASFDTSKAKIACAEVLQQAEKQARQAQRGMWQPAVAWRPPTYTATLVEVAQFWTPTTTQTARSFTPTVTATLTLGTATETATATQATATPGFNGVQITDIFYLGEVPVTESDEYARITNNGSEPVDMLDWTLYADDAGWEFTFPEITLQPGQSCLVYTNEVHENSCGEASFESDTPIWNNDGDCGYLYDAEGNQVGPAYCYP